MGPTMDADGGGAGIFAALEEPDLLIEDLRQFCGSLRR
jgi:hypothetical protein